MTRRLTSQVSLVSIPGEGATVTYAAVRSAEAVSALANLTDAGYGDAMTLSWDLLPGALPAMAWMLRRGDPRQVVLIGTADCGEWTSWHLPIPAPALHSQAEAS